MFEIFKNLFKIGNSQNLSKFIEEGAFLVDVRSPNEYSQGSVTGAVNIPLNTLPSQLSKFKDKRNIIVFCRSGNRSSQAKSILEQNGFNNIINGGTWQNVNKFVNN